jgi:flagellar motility protein MotE (MotC chaperone)
MIRFIRDLRLIPIALIASACLLVLKTADLVLDGSQWLAGAAAPAGEGGSVVRVAPDATQPPGQTGSWARQMFNFPDGSGGRSAIDTAPSAADRAKLRRANAERGNDDITGSIAGAPAPAEPKTAEPKTAAPANGAAKAEPPKAGPGAKAPQPPPVDGRVISLDGAALPSGAERAILERLQQRREELDTRARELDIRENLIKAAEQRIDAHLAEVKEVESELDIRENLIKAAEQRIDAHLAEVKEVESRIKVETEQKDEAEAARFKGLITLYENMKPRDAAKIFNRLDMEVLIKVAAQINPRTMADIMAQMSPDVAEHLTVELASKAQGGPAKNSPAELPKIEGKPTGQ